MTKYPLLIITLVLINTIQWINSIKQNKKKFNLEDHLLVSKNNYHILPDTSMRSTPTSSLKSMEYQINNNDIKSSNGRVINPTSNLKNYEYSIFISKSQFGKKSPQIKYLPVSNQIETRKDEDFDPELQPGPHDINNCKKSQHFCNKVKSYPREKISKLLTNNKNIGLTSLFFKEPLNNYSKTSSIDLQPLCFQKESVIYPEAALNGNDEWRYVVQDVKNNFTQGINIVQCNDNVRNCTLMALPENINTCCVQEYMSTKLVAINTSRKMYYEKFMLPSCCKCKYRYSQSNSEKRKNRSDICSDISQ